jgi:hypothetical protein
MKERNNVVTSTAQWLFRTSEERRFVVEKHNALEGLEQNMEELAESLATIASPCS